MIQRVQCWKVYAKDLCRHFDLIFSKNIGADNICIRFGYLSSILIFSSNQIIWAFCMGSKILSVWLKVLSIRVKMNIHFKLFSDGKCGNGSKRYNRKRDTTFPKNENVCNQTRRSIPQKSKAFDKRPPARGANKSFSTFGNGGRREEVRLSIRTWIYLIQMYDVWCSAGNS